MPEPPSSGPSSTMPTRTASMIQRLRRKARSQASLRQRIQL
jgi:hypothetical protein